MGSSTKIFSLAEANELVEVIGDFTSDVVKQFDDIRQRHDIRSTEGGVPDAVLNEVEEALREWSERVVELGAHPKGYFTVDFASADPELLYCWSFGEKKIQYTHKVWENFSHRRPMATSMDSEADHLKWIN